MACTGVLNIAGSVSRMVAVSATAAADACIWPSVDAGSGRPATEAAVQPAARNKKIDVQAPQAEQPAEQQLLLRLRCEWCCGFSPAPQLTCLPFIVICEDSYCFVCAYLVVGIRGAASAACVYIAR